MKINPNHLSKYIDSDNPKGKPKRSQTNKQSDPDNQSTLKNATRNDKARVKGRR